MPRAMILRIQTKTDRFSLSTLNPESTLSDLQRALKEKTELPPAAQRILIGYPPREVEPCDLSSTLVSLRIRSGDTLRLEEKETEVRTTGQPSSPDGVSMCGEGSLPPLDPVLVSELLSPQLSPRRGALIRSVLLCGAQESGSDLRELAAGIILSDPEKYSSVILGRSHQEYVQWLRQKESWGGAIELRVFSEHFKVELDVVDIQTQRVDRFGEDKGYAKCAFLLYDGIHYDPLVTFTEGGMASQQGIFPISDDAILVEAIEIARKACQARQFTDLSQFSLRCLVCQKGLKGQVDAVSHAKQTGHGNFGEI